MIGPCAGMESESTLEILSHLKSLFCRLWKDCLIFNFSHFNITLAGDYVIALLMISIMLSVCVSH